MNDDHDPTRDARIEALNAAIGVAYEALARVEGLAAADPDGPAISCGAPGSSEWAAVRGWLRGIRLGGAPARGRWVQQIWGSCRSEQLQPLPPGTVRLRATSPIGGVILERLSWLLQHHADGAQEEAEQALVHFMGTKVGRGEPLVLEISADTWSQLPAGARSGVCFYANAGACLAETALPQGGETASQPN